jgi:hypothetical protein
MTTTLKTCAAFFFLGAALAVAQETRGNISGTVADPQGGVIAGASVTVRSLDTAVATPVKTNSSGYYLASLLIPGKYEVTVEAAGFKRSVRSGLILGSASRWISTVKLEVGAVSESVTVSADTQMLDTASVTVGQNIDRRGVDSFPVFANMTILMSRFMPGVASSSVVQYVNQGYASRTSTTPPPCSPSEGTNGRLTEPPTAARAARWPPLHCRNDSGGACRDRQLRRLFRTRHRDRNLHHDPHRH